METKTENLTDQIRLLREKTGAGMMDCKRALTEAGGDFHKAVETLRKKGLADAAKKSSRATREGMLAAYVSPDGNQGALLELYCETDFVAKTPDFQALARMLAQKVAERSLTFPEGAAGEIQPAIAKLGENILLGRFDRFELDGPGFLSHYIHPVGFKKGAFLVLGGPSAAVGQHPATAELAKELGLQIVAMAPRWLRREEIPNAEVEKEKDIYAAQLRNEGKPEASIPKIVEGKLNKLFYQALCLLDGVSMRDNKTPIAKLIEEASSKAGGPIRVQRFVRYQVGE